MTPATSDGSGRRTEPASSFGSYTVESTTDHGPCQLSPVAFRIMSANDPRFSSASGTGLPVTQMQRGFTSEAPPREGDSREKGGAEGGRAEREPSAMDPE